MGLLSGAMYAMDFDAATIARIGALMNTLPVFERYYLSAMRYSVSLVNTRAQQNAPVLTGTLRRAIRGQVLSPMLGKVGVLRNVPYARRRELGFDAQHDALGRYYPLDPKDPDKRAKMFYLRRALEDSRIEISTAFRTATTLSIRTIVL